jgi:hypothetical protein
MRREPIHFRWIGQRGFLAAGLFEINRDSFERRRRRIDHAASLPCAERLSILPCKKLSTARSRVIRLFANNPFTGCSPFIAAP